MGLKLLLLFVALAVLASSAPTSLNEQQKEVAADVSRIPEYIQYWLPISPPDELLFRNGILAGAGGICSIHQLEYCQKDFASDLGTTVDVFNDPERFAEYIRGLYKLEIQKALLKMCAAQVSFRNCLSVFYQPCTDALTIFSNQIKDLGKAFTLAGVYDDIEFDCGGGLTQGLVNWKCIVTVNNKPNYDDTMKPCWDAFQQAITDPNQYCSAGQNLSSCLAAAYRSLDTCVNDDVAWWVCERANRRMKLEGYCDENTCASVFPPPPTPKPSNSEDDNDGFMDFVNSGGLLGETKMKFFKLIGLPRGHRKLA